MSADLRRGLILLALLPAFLPTEAVGQTPPPRASQVEDTTTLVFEREIFFYPRYERRNPFRSLASGRESGPLFEEVILMGVIFSPNPDLSVAVIGPRSQPAQGQGQAQVRNFRLRRGETLGNFRILEIQPARVVVSVEEFGMTEQRIMELRRPGQGGLE